MKYSLGAGSGVAPAQGARLGKSDAAEDKNAADRQQRGGQHDDRNDQPPEAGLARPDQRTGLGWIYLNAGRYEVDFPADISQCAWQGTLVVAHDGGLLLAQPDPVAGSLGLAPRFDGALDNSAVYVETWDENGTNADRDFTVSVICTPEDNIFIGPAFPVVPAVVSP